MRIILIILFTIAANASTSSVALEVADIQVDWKHRNGDIEFTIVAPTSGWVALGFNDVNSIVGAELIMANVKDGEAHAKHFYVVGPGNPKPVKSLGRESIVLDVEGEIANGTISMKLLLEDEIAGRAPLTLKSGENVFLIVAYSVSPDFDHHSRIREHISVKL
ncbi:MAG: DOMON domain-containing protein [Pseudomonadota bacterium]